MAKAGLSQFQWFSLLCIVMIFLGLAGHLIVDAIYGLADLAGRRQCGAIANGNSWTGSQPVMCSLLTGSVLPGVIIVGGLPTMISMLTRVSLTLSNWLAAPLVHPPDHAPLIT